MSACSHEYRCRACQKLLFKGFIIEGSLEIKCKHCHAFNAIQASQQSEYLCLVKNCPQRVTWKTGG